MKEWLLYEYAVIRIVPRVEREEFVNAGVILYCRDVRFLSMSYQVSSQKILMMDPEADVRKLNLLLQAFEKVCAGSGQRGIPVFPVAERFRWLTAVKSTMIQTSPVHSGLTMDPAMELERLFRQLVF